MTGRKRGSTRFRPEQRQRNRPHTFCRAAAGGRIANGRRARSRPLHPNDIQRAALKVLQHTRAQASDALKAAARPRMLTPPARLAAAARRLEAMQQAIKNVSEALDDFYSTLNDEQKAQFRGDRAEADGLVFGIIPVPKLASIRLCLPQFGVRRCSGSARANARTSGTSPSRQSAGDLEATQRIREICRAASDSAEKVGAAADRSHRKLKPDVKHYNAPPRRRWKSP